MRFCRNVSLVWPSVERNNLKVLYMWSIFLRAWANRRSSVPKKLDMFYLGSCWTLSNPAAECVVGALSPKKKIKSNV